MRDIIVLNILYPMFKLLLNKLPRISLCLSVILIAFSFPVPFLSSFGYFLLGGCIVKFNWRLSDFDKIPLWLSTVLFAISITLKLVFSYSIISVIAGFLGIMFFIKLSKLIYSSITAEKIFSKLVPFTFIIYVGHELALSSFKKIFLKLLPINSVTVLLQYIVLPVIIIAACVFAGKLLKTYLPKVYSFITGE